MLAIALLLWAVWLHTDGPLAQPSVGTESGPPVRSVTVSRSATARALLANRRLSLTPQARRDLQRGAVDPRLIRVLGGLLKEHRLAVSVFRTGHTKYVAGTGRVSNHYLGRAADIWQVDGGHVRAGHGPSRRAVAWLTKVRGPNRPTEVGSPFREFDHGAGDGVFTDPAHRDHIHVAVG